MLDINIPCMCTTPECWKEKRCVFYTSLALYKWPKITCKEMCVCTKWFKAVNIFIKLYDTDRIVLLDDYGYNLCQHWWESLFSYKNKMLSVWSVWQKHWNLSKHLLLSVSITLLKINHQRRRKKNLQIDLPSFTSLITHIPLINLPLPPPCLPLKSNLPCAF